VILLNRKCDEKIKRKDRNAVIFLTIYSICCFIFILIVFLCFVEKTKALPTISEEINVVIKAQTIIPYNDGKTVTDRFNSDWFEGDRFSRTLTKERVGNERVQAKTVTNTAEVYSEATGDEYLYVPANYTKMSFATADVPIYVFVDDASNLQYRVSVKRTVGLSKIMYGLVPCQMKLENGKFAFHYDVNAEFVKIDEEPFGSVELVDADSTSSVSPLIKVYGHTGLYYKINDNGKYEYYAYGHYKGGENAYFVADNYGKVINGTLPLDLKDDNLN